MGWFGLVSTHTGPLWVAVEIAEARKAREVEAWWWFCPKVQAE